MLVIDTSLVPFSTFLHPDNDILFVFSLALKMCASLNDGAVFPLITGPECRGLSIMWSGRQGDYNVMVIDLLGPSLEDLFK
jgi:hypothetical protein